MAKEKTELVVSLVGMVEAIIVALVKFIKEAGGDVGECLCHLASAKGEGTIRKVAELIVAEARVFTEAKTEIVKELALLKQIAIVSAGGAAKLTAKDHLKEANIGWMGDNFKKLFLKKTEENIGDAAIAVHRLERASLDAPIMTELGNRAEIKLAHFFSLLKAQSKGQEGALAVDGSANIAYIIGNDGNFWAVNAYWDSGDRYWDVVANSVGSPSGWDAGDRVLSCDSL